MSLDRACRMMPRILCVDDDEQIRTLLRERLEDAHEIVEAGDASEALALALQSKPDCILLDLMMPGYTGFELCQTLSSIRALRSTPIVIISAYPAAEYKEFCVNLGAMEYLEKPIDFHRLKPCLAEVVKKKQPERRREVRARLGLMVKLKGTDGKGEAFELLTIPKTSAGAGSCAAVTPC